MTYDSDKFWEITATVVPVLALAFVLEVRYIRFDRMGAFMRLNQALTHALTIIVLLASQAASLLHLLGSRQARWAESFALYAILASLSVILLTPTSRLLILGLYSNTAADYVRYWKRSRALRGLRRSFRQTQRQIREGEDLIKKLDGAAAGLSAESAALSVVDLHSAWKNAEILRDLEDLHVRRADFVGVLATHRDTLAKHKKKVRKLEKQLLSYTGRRAKLIMKMMDKQVGGPQQSHD